MVVKTFQKTNLESWNEGGAKLIKRIVPLNPYLQKERIAA